MLGPQEGEGLQTGLSTRGSYRNPGSGERKGLWRKSPCVILSTHGRQKRGPWSGRGPRPGRDGITLQINWTDLRKFQGQAWLGQWCRCLRVVSILALHSGPWNPLSTLGVHSVTTPSKGQLQSQI